MHTVGAVGDLRHAVRVLRRTPRRLVHVLNLHQRRDQLRDGVGVLDDQQRALVDAESANEVLNIVKMYFIKI